MSFYKDFANKYLIRELELEINKDIILLGTDGMSYFGNLQAIYNDRIALLLPAKQAVTNTVECLTPAERITFRSFMKVDLLLVVAKAMGISGDPIFPVPATMQSGSLRTEDAPNFSKRQESHELICELKEQIGDFVDIGVLGGFRFEGTLSSVENELARLSKPTIFAPGANGRLIQGSGSVTINLETITSNGVPQFVVVDGPGAIEGARVTSV